MFKQDVPESSSAARGVQLNELPQDGQRDKHYDDPVVAGQDQ